MKQIRRGASHASMRIRNDAEPSKTFPVARRNINEFLKSLSFVKVLEVSHVPAKEGRPAFYHGLGETLSNSRHNYRSEQVFFDKGGRLRNNAVIEVGPCKLIDAAMGRDHMSALPHVGDILVGVLAANTKPKTRISKVIRSWSRHGKIIMELSRMIEFGTTASETDVRKILNQGECDMALAFASSAQTASLSFHIKSAAHSSDDFWVLARLILWGNIRPLVLLHAFQTSAKIKFEPGALEVTAAQSLRISCTALEFVNGIAFRFEDAEIITMFQSLVEIPEPPPQPAYIPPVYQPTYDYVSYVPSIPAPVQGSTSPPYAASSPPYNPEATSPMYAPSSPPYAPSAPSPKSPEIKPETEKEDINQKHKISFVQDDDIPDDIPPAQVDNVMYDPSQVKPIEPTELEKEQALKQYYEQYQAWQNSHYQAYQNAYPQSINNVSQVEQKYAVQYSPRSPYAGQIVPK